MSTLASPTPRPPTPANRFGLDYRAEAARFGPPIVPIVDMHLHVNGERASRLYEEAARLFGVERVYSQTRLSDAPVVQRILGGRVKFLAVPDWSGKDRGHAFREGFLEHMAIWHERFGARMVKLWSAPRLWDLVGGDPRDVVPFDSPWRVRALELAERLGMMVMVHVADPDTWFATKYSDRAKYGGVKAEHYIGLERMMDRFTMPWVLAHMGGWPEDLGALDSLLARHPNCHIDTSATKWVVRALGAHEPARVRAFFERWRGRVFFGSDIVTLDDHLQPAKTTTSVMSDLADSPEAAFDLYASRYYALRTMFESHYDGESPIADPDLKMVEPDRHTPMSAPRLRGLSLPPDLLKTLYAGAADAVITKWYDTH